MLKEAGYQTVSTPSSRQRRLPEVTSGIPVTREVAAMI